MNDQSEQLFPICAELRTKKYYLLGRPPRTSAEVLDASNDCWCARTDDRIGPDKDPVHPDDCRRGRACFQALLERPEALGGATPRTGNGAAG